MKSPNLTTLGILFCSVFIIASAVNDGTSKYFWGLPHWGLAIWLVFRKKENRVQRITLILIAIFFIWTVTTRETNTLLYPILGERAVVKTSFQIVFLSNNFDGSPVPTFFGKKYKEWEQESLEEKQKSGEKHMTFPDFTSHIIKKEAIPVGTNLEICRVTSPSSMEKTRYHYLHFCFGDRMFKIGTDEDEEIRGFLNLLTYSPSLLPKNPEKPLWPPFDKLSNLMYWPLVPLKLLSQVQILINDLKNPDD